MTIATFKTDKSEKPAYHKLEKGTEGQNSKKVHPDKHLHSNRHLSDLDNHHSTNLRTNYKRWVVGMVVMMITTVICILFLLCFKLNMSLAHTSWPLLGHPSNDQRSRLHSGDATLVVKYKLENSLDETTVYRNYKTGYETMKWTSEGGGGGGKSVCYVRKMKMNDMRNSTAITKSLNQLYKSHFYEVITPPPEASKGLDWLIGSNAHLDCSQSRLIWIEPMQYEVYVSPASKQNNSLANELTNENNNNYNNNSGNHRVRRSLKFCRTTCCWRVCCCDVHHFQWQVAEEFNCNHVCNRCTSSYKSVIERLC